MTTAEKIASLRRDYETTDRPCGAFFSKEAHEWEAARVRMKAAFLPLLDMAEAGRYHQWKALSEAASRLAALPGGKGSAQ